ncbi:hypothetical protein D3C80_1276350 [compost metagenome]
MQCASSTTNNEIGTCCRKLRKRSFFRRSTEIIRIFNSPLRARAITSLASQERQLVLHQRQQRRDHQCQVRQQQGGQLITQGLARPGRENCRSRTSGQHRTDCRFLARPELWITKDLFEGVVHKRSLR